MKVLALVGSGIKTISHITEEVNGFIRGSEKVLYLVNEPLLEEYIQKISKSSESLESIYFNSKTRETAYGNIANHICKEIERVNSLCVVIYGHPCVFATPGLLALSKVDPGIKTIVCPGISAQDCLYADFRFDPAEGGIQFYDATDYMLYGKTIDCTSHQIIYQIGMIGNLGLPSNRINKEAISFIKSKLLHIYKKDKKAFIYEAALYPGKSPTIVEFILDDLDLQNLTTLSTLYIPPEEHLKEPNLEALKLIKS